jgi:hypothetical protein
MTEGCHDIFPGGSELIFFNLRKARHYRKINEKKICRQSMISGVSVELLFLIHRNGEVWRKRWSKLMNRVELLLEEWVYPNLDRGRLLRELHPSDQENRYVVTCPQCHRKSARMYKSGVILFCECGYFRDIMEFMKDRYALTEHEAFKELAYMADCPEAVNLYHEVEHNLVKGR